MTKSATFLGLAAPLFYCGIVVLGGFLWPQYSHLADPISLLTSAQAPDTSLMNVLFVVYDLLLFFFGLLWWLGRSRESHTTETAALALALVGLLGIAMYFFRQDAPGTAMSPQGMVHIILAAAMSILTMVAIFVRGRADWRLSRHRDVAVYGFVSLAVVFVSGGLAAASMAQHWSLGGLFERCTIGTFEVWVFVQAWRLASRRSLAG